MKKFLSVVLVTVLILSVIPMTVWAEEPSYDNKFFVSYDGDGGAAVEMAGYPAPTLLQSINWDNWL